MWVLQLGRKLGAGLEVGVPLIVIGFQLGAGLEVGVPLIVIGFLRIGECVRTCLSALEERGPSPRSPRAPAPHTWCLCALGPICPSVSLPSAVGSASPWSKQ